LAIEPTKHHTFHALTFVDFVGEGAGLLLVHAGTQWFNQDARGTISNLLMREWESYWGGEYGWPRYSEYRHALFPHHGQFTHCDRVRASTEFTQKLIPVLGTPRSGSLPARKSFIAVEPDSVQLSAFRRKDNQRFELRLLEIEGRQAESTVELAIPVAEAVETNLLGNKVADVARTGSKLNFKIHPWKFRTFELAQGG